MNPDKIPADLRNHAQWILWRNIVRESGPTKVPFGVDGKTASSTNPDTWATFDEAHAAYDPERHAGMGFVFSHDDDFCGIDLDGCRNPETGEISAWARELITLLDSYSEVSPSQTGVKVFVRAKFPLERGRKTVIPGVEFTGKEPAIEIYDHARYFAITSKRLGGVSPAVESRQEQVDQIAAKFFPVAQAQSASPTLAFDSEAAILERARRYLNKLPPSESGKGGHNAAFRAACVLVLGFGFSEGDALSLMRDWNHGCKPAWSEKELQHKVKQASIQPGERCYLRDKRVEEWNNVRLPAYQAPLPAQDFRVTTLEAAANDALAGYVAGKTSLVELGIPDVDHAIGGGVAFGEMVILAARPSHGKSAVALQCLHHFALNGLPSLMISEEMSKLALGKRVIQHVSHTPEEHWRTSSDLVASHLKEHFGQRAPCYVVESCGTTDRAVEAIRQHVVEHGVKCVVVDYAQLLGSAGKSRYEQVTNTSAALRRLTGETGVLMMVLAQLGREVEKRERFTPVNSDLKDSGQLEQDADVIIHMCWPWKLDTRKHPSEFMFFFGKNRNRAINVPSVQCLFDPRRQLFSDDPKNHPDEFSRGQEWTPYADDDRPSITGGGNGGY